MITFITGAPGSGKTLYTISKLLAGVVGTTVKGKNDAGDDVEYKRIIYTNIRGLLLDHEMIDETHLNTWHEWAKPGSIICFDEVQKPWPKAPTGSRVPECIQNLETHRHMGVDFIVMTQHPLLVHGNLVNLVGRHLHIRRVANMALAVVYEWDHTSKSLLYKNSITKSPWRYDKSVFKLYKSAELHTKQPRKAPGLLWFLLIGVCLLAYLAPSFYERFNDRAFNAAHPYPKSQPVGTQILNGVSTPTPTLKTGPMPVSASPSAYLDQYKPRVNGQPWTAPRYDDLTHPSKVPVIRGCVDKGPDASEPRAFCVLDGGVFIYPPLELVQRFVRDRIFFDFENSGRAGDQAAAQPRAGDRAIGQERPPVIN